MESVILSELECLLNKDKITGSERIKIVAICNDLVCHGALLVDIQNSLKPIIEAKTFSASQHIPALVSSVLDVIKHVEYYKDVNEARMKYVVYCVLLSGLLKYYPSVLKTIDTELLRNLYVDAIMLVLLIPQTIKINKKSCGTCLGNSFKVLSFLNKNKLIVE